MEIWKSIIDLLKGIAWPLCALIMVVLVRGAIEDFLRNAIMKFRGPGGMEIEAQRFREEARAPEGMDSLYQKSSSDLVEISKVTEQQRQDIKLLIHRSILYEFMFLNLFLVPHTKEVLKWIAGPRLDQSREGLHRYWLLAIPDRKELDAVIDVLLEYQLVTAQNSSLSVNDKGTDFIRYINTGQLPVFG